MKYIVSSGNSYLTSINNDDFEISTTKEPIKYNFIGDAMRIAAKLNKLVGKATFKILSTIL